MYKNLKNNNKFAEGNSTAFRLFSVITGRVPVILVQRVINLVNKFALLLHKYRFSQDCRNKSGNDGCWGRWLGACCNVFNTPHSANELTLKAKDDYKRVLQSGRSMIEMLGVLTIIAVLSVGGIAGYSKAMNKYKVNKLISEYNMVIIGLLEQKDNIVKSVLTKPSAQVYINDLVLAAGIVPNHWSINGDYLNDGAGNVVGIYATNQNRQTGDFPMIYIDFMLNGITRNGNGSQISTNFSDTLCVEIFSNLVQPLHDFMRRGLVYRNSYRYQSYFGSKYCGNGRKCLKDITLSEIKEACNSCVTSKELCSVNISF